MAARELEWETPGTCPVCGVVTEHFWYGFTQHIGRQGALHVSKCVSEDCQGLVLWTANEGFYEIVYPQTGLRHPPEEAYVPKQPKILLAGVTPFGVTRVSPGEDVLGNFRM